MFSFTPSPKWQAAEGRALPFCTTCRPDNLASGIHFPPSPTDSLGSGQAYLSKNYDPKNVTHLGFKVDLFSPAHSEEGTPPTHTQDGLEEDRKPAFVRIEKGKTLGLGKVTPVKDEPSLGEAGA